MWKKEIKTVLQSLEEKEIKNCCEKKQKQHANVAKKNYEIAKSLLHKSTFVERERTSKYIYRIELEKNHLKRDGRTDVKGNGFAEPHSNKKMTDIIKDEDSDL